MSALYNKLLPIVTTTKVVCEQMEFIIQQLPKSKFTKPIPILSDASIGQHFRHIIEFYLELLKGIPTGSVNYENRQRDLLIETLPGHAISQLQEITSSIDSLNFSTEIFLSVRFSANEEEQDSNLKTSVARELLYTIDHAIHHLAIINIALQSEFPYIEVPNNLGVAPSTIRYREECAR